MKVALFTLTRDRLLYTQHCFKVLREKAGYPFDHYIVDNGSEDGTEDWLYEHMGEFQGVKLNGRNLGISSGNNIALDMILDSGIQYDLIAKFDNDCEVVSDNLLAQIVSLYGELKLPALLSPRVEGINKQPLRGYYYDVMFSHPIGFTGHIGGLCSFCNASLYLSYRYPLDIPKARGDDSAFSAWVKGQNYIVGYIEDLVVNHYETTTGQAERYPDYFKRKWQEEEEMPDGG